MATLEQLLADGEVTGALLLRGGYNADELADIRRVFEFGIEVGRKLERASGPGESDGD